MAGGGIADELTIQGLTMRTNDDQSVLKVSGNAQMIHPDFTVFSDQMTYDKTSGMFSGTGNVTFVQNDRSTHASCFDYNANTEVGALHEARFETSLPHHTDSVFVTATRLDYYPDYQMGTKGVITTCDVHPPHYDLRVGAFKFYPNKRLILQNVYLRNPVFGIPLNMWTPAYIIDLEKKDVTYLLPQIGRNELEGFFVKSQVDYVIHDDWFGRAYLNYLSRKGLGLGTRLSYDTAIADGSLYYYAISGTDYYEQDWDNQIMFPKRWQLNTRLYSQFMYGFLKNDSRIKGFSADLNKTENNRQHELSYAFDQNELTTLTSKNSKWSYLNQRDYRNKLSVMFQKREQRIQQDRLDVRTQYDIPYGIQNRNTVSYVQQTQALTGIQQDRYIKLFHELNRTWDRFGRVSVALDLYKDMTDITTNKRPHIVQKVPEMDVVLNRYSFFNNRWSLNQSFQYGHYVEHYFIREMDLYRRYEQSRLVLDQTLVRDRSYSFFNNLIDIQLKNTMSYRQFFYFSGDQTYALISKMNYGVTILSALKSDTVWSRERYPDNGNTPFYFDEPPTSNLNQIKETLQLYYRDTNTASIQYSFGYRWDTRRRLDDEYLLRLSPHSSFQAMLRARYFWLREEFSPLEIQLTVRPTSRLSTTIQSNYDLNKREIMHLDQVFSINTSQHWKYRWILEAYYRHAPLYDQYYELQTLSITKDLHKRTLTFIYNRLLEEFRIQFTFNAFPNNMIQVRKNKYEGIGFGGGLNEAGTDEYDRRGGGGFNEAITNE